jgi:hypothetical protein
MVPREDHNHNKADQLYDETEGQDGRLTDSSEIPEGLMAHEINDGTVRLRKKSLGRS